MEYVSNALFRGGLQSVCDELCIEFPEGLFALERLNLSSSNRVQMGDDLFPILDEMPVLFLMILIHVSSRENDVNEKRCDAMMAGSKR